MQKDLKHIIFFVDPAWRENGQYSPLMYPFWGNPLTEQTPFKKELFDRFSFNTDHYSITGDASKADAVLMPFSHNLALLHHPQLLDACFRKAVELHVPLLIDGIGDIEQPINLPNTYVLRYGGYRFEKKPYEIIIPPYADDMLTIYCDGVLKVRNKSTIPVIGFAGWSSLTIKQKLRSFIKELPDRVHGVFDSKYKAKKKGVFFRAEAIETLVQSPKVKMNLLKRTSYSGHANTKVGAATDIRQEFVDNLLQSDYGLDVRGDANASTRLFEMLSLGKVPIIIDTERNFPFSNELDYSMFALFVDFRDIRALPEKIADFHNALSNEKFKEMQSNARKAYEKYFRVDALMQRIISAMIASSL